MLASALLLSIGSLVVVHVIQAWAARSFASRSALYAAVILSSSDRDPSDPVQFLMRPGILYARVLDGEEVQQAARIEDLQEDALPGIPPRTGLPLSRIVRVSGFLVADIVFPRDEGVAVQLGVDAAGLARGNGRLARIGAVAATFAWLLLSVASVILLRRRDRKRKRRDIASAPEVVARDAGRRIRAGGVVLCVDEQRLQVGEASIDLTPKQTSLLDLLVNQPGRTFTDAEILVAVWPGSPYATSSDVKQHVYLIRKRLAAAGLSATDLLVTVPGRGYHIAPFELDLGVENCSTDATPANRQTARQKEEE